MCVICILCVQSATKRFNKESEKWKLVSERMQQPTEETVEGENLYVAEPHEVLIPSEHLTLGRPLGKGEFCSVHSGQWINNGHKVSVDSISVGARLRLYRLLCASTGCCVLEQAVVCVYRLLCVITGCCVLVQAVVC